MRVMMPMLAGALCVVAVPALSADIAVPGRTGAAAAPSATRVCRVIAKPRVRTAPSLVATLRTPAAERPIATPIGPRIALIIGTGF
jgi:hypothetical protein